MRSLLLKICAVAVIIGLLAACHFISDKLQPLDNEMEKIGEKIIEDVIEDEIKEIKDGQEARKNQESHERI